MGRIIKRIQRNARAGGWMKEAVKPKRSRWGRLTSSHGDEAVKEERRLANEHREKTRVEAKGRRSNSFLGRIVRLFRGQER